MKETDWTKYYRNKKSWFSKVTQKVTMRQIKAYYMKYCGPNKSILELGGGNSCFIDGICKSICSPSSYSIIDNNQLSLSLLRKRNPNCECLCLDLMKNIEPSKQYDFVYSIGLIEHFSNENISKVIKNHFNFCKDDGIVLISFPTPTLQYRLIRRGMEWLKIWQFWDETPLTLQQFTNYIWKDVTILEYKLMRLLPLTQTMCVIKKNNI